jgi:hypothetical protein
MGQTKEQYVPAVSVNPKLPSGAKVLAGYTFMGPTSKGGFMVTRPDGGDPFEMSSHQIYTPDGGPVVDKYTGRVCYIPPRSDEVTAVDVAAGFKAFSDAMLPAAAGAMQLYQMSRGGGQLTPEQMYMLQMQQQQRSSSGTLLALGGLVVVGGLVYLVTREKED